MIDIFRRIKKIMIEMHNSTSENDVRYESMQDVIELCDEGTLHFTDDGK